MTPTARLGLTVLALLAVSLVPLSTSALPLSRLQRQGKQHALEQELHQQQQQQRRVGQPVDRIVGVQIGQDAQTAVTCTISVEPNVAYGDAFLTALRGCRQLHNLIANADPALVRAAITVKHKSPPVNAAWDDVLEALPVSDRHNPQKFFVAVTVTPAQVADLPVRHGPAQYDVTPWKLIVPNPLAPPAFTGALAVALAGASVLNTAAVISWYYKSVPGAPAVVTHGEFAYNTGLPVGNGYTSELEVYVFPASINGVATAYHKPGRDDPIAGVRATNRRLTTVTDFTWYFNGPTYPMVMGTLDLGRVAALVLTTNPTTWVASLGRGNDDADAARKTLANGLLALHGGKRYVHWGVMVADLRVTYTVASANRGGDVITKQIGWMGAADNSLRENAGASDGNVQYRHTELVLLRELRAFILALEGDTRLRVTKIDAVIATEKPPCTHTFHHCANTISYFESDAARGWLRTKDFTPWAVRQATSISAEVGGLYRVDGRADQAAAAQRIPCAITRKTIGEYPGGKDAATPVENPAVTRWLSEHQF